MRGVNIALTAPQQVQMILGAWSNYASISKQVSDATGEDNYWVWMDQVV